jgi:hypothetical protein
MEDHQELLILTARGNIVRSIGQGVVRGQGGFGGQGG